MNLVRLKVRRRHRRSLQDTDDGRKPQPCGKRQSPNGGNIRRETSGATWSVSDSSSNSSVSVSVCLADAGSAVPARRRRRPQQQQQQQSASADTACLPQHQEPPCSSSSSSRRTLCDRTVARSAMVTFDGSVRTNGSDPTDDGNVRTDGNGLCRHRSLVVFPNRTGALDAVSQHSRNSVQSANRLVSSRFLKTGFRRRNAAGVQRQAQRSRRRSSALSDSRHSTGSASTRSSRRAPDTDNNNNDDSFLRSYSRSNRPATQPNVQHGSGRRHNSPTVSDVHDNIHDNEHEHGNHRQTAPVSVQRNDTGTGARSDQDSDSDIDIDIERPCLTRNDRPIQNSQPDSDSEESLDDRTIIRLRRKESLMTAPKLQRQGGNLNLFYGRRGSSLFQDINRSWLRVDSAECNSEEHSDDSDGNDNDSDSDSGNATIVDNESSSSTTTTITTVSPLFQRPSSNATRSPTIHEAEQEADIRPVQLPVLTPRKHGSLGNDSTDPVRIDHRHHAERNDRESNNSQEQQVQNAPAHGDGDSDEEASVSRPSSGSTDGHDDYLLRHRASRNLLPRRNRPDRDDEMATSKPCELKHKRSPSHPSSDESQQQALQSSSAHSDRSQRSTTSTDTTKSISTVTEGAAITVVATPACVHTKDGNEDDVDQSKQLSSQSSSSSSLERRRQRRQHHNVDDGDEDGDLHLRSSHSVSCNSQNRRNSAGHSISSHSQSSAGKRRLRFTHAEVREIPTIIGSAPVSLGGPPLTMDWHVERTTIYGISEMEIIKKHNRSNRSYRPLNARERADLLHNTCGFSVDDIVHASQVAQYLHQQRLETRLLDHLESMQCQVMTGHPDDIVYGEHGQAYYGNHYYGDDSDGAERPIQQDNYCDYYAQQYGYADAEATLSPEQYYVLQQIRQDDTLTEDERQAYCDELMQQQQQQMLAEQAYQDDQEQERLQQHTELRSRLHTSTILEEDEHEVTDDEGAFSDDSEDQAGQRCDDDGDIKDDQSDHEDSEVESNSSDEFHDAYQDEEHVVPLVDRSSNVPHHPTRIPSLEQQRMLFRRKLSMRSLGSQSSLDCDDAISDEGSVYLDRLHLAMEMRVRAELETSSTDLHPRELKRQQSIDSFSVFEDLSDDDDDGGMSMGELA